MFKKSMLHALAAAALVPAAHAGVDLIAIGSISGSYEDLSTRTAAPLENGVPGNRLGGLGSGLAYAGGNTFLALPDRGPNAKPYNPLVDDTVSYIVRFQTLRLALSPSDAGSALPFTLTPTLRKTTLLSSPTPLVYGSGAGLGNRIDGVTPIGSGAPALNAARHRYYFTGRSDNFDPTRPSTNTLNARLDPESIRVSNDGERVYVSDEYGPYVHEFERSTGKRIRSFKLPANLAITRLSAQSAVEIADNTVGRVTNKGMEGLAITPDGRLLVGFMQANLEQDKKGSLRIVTIDTYTGATRQYAYKLTDGSGVSEILAINNHEFLVDERDGSGMADTPLLTDTASAAKVKKLYVIDLDGARDVSDLSGDLSAYAVTKSAAPFLDVVAKLTAAGTDPRLIPSKIEGIAFGPDVSIKGVTKHTLFVANDNDFLATIADPLKLPSDATRTMVPNPNQFYVFSFDDHDLPRYVPQRINDERDRDHGRDHDDDED
ncbi:esterase-like activity of phytase family protein [Variovorax sp. J31P207]|uniref:esterase-like activity of phytase family protein n=1 Tax=Variovorax sp. J31P207 TaxID=3053510 RepID=UPI0025785725|nr:esterase-like activity of phytase family protein [Variovorax sp. J31P207]MDM0071168.1 esterase-like activity of phytase family protein [Variovorax sp. J31P207]